MNDAKAKRTISIAVAYVILCSTAIGMEFRKEADRKHAGLFSIYATGQIVPSDRTTFERLATDGSRDIIFLSSPGGSAAEGMAIGATIRERSINTAVCA